MARVALEQQQGENLGSLFAIPLLGYGKITSEDHYWVRFCLAYKELSSTPTETELATILQDTYKVKRTKAGFELTKRR
jgi:hypothetical protein